MAPTAATLFGIYLRIVSIMTKYNILGGMDGEGGSHDVCQSLEMALSPVTNGSTLLS